MSGAAEPSSRTWIAAALRDGVASPLPDQVFPDELIAVADYEGVLPLLEWRLRNGPEWDALPEGFRLALVQGARTAAAQTLFHEHELRRVSGALAGAGLRALLLKGPAFARWLYPEPHLRVSGDIDLLFASREDAEQAAQALAPLGYELAFEPGSAVYEMTSRLNVGGVSRLELDLHSRLINTEAYARKFGFEELWEASIALAGMGDRLRGLGATHSLAHACLHRAHDLGLRRPDRLKWLYDIHLMLERMDAAAWADFLALSRDKGLCGVGLRSIGDAQALFGHAAPAELMGELHRQAEAEPLDFRRLDDWRYMQWQGFKALPTMTDRLRWLWGRLVPTRSHLEELHGEGTRTQLLVRRAGRALSRLRNRPE